MEERLKRTHSVRPWCKMHRVWLPREIEIQCKRGLCVEGGPGVSLPMPGG